VKWPPIDNWRSASPFVSTSTEEPTHKLVFVLRLPEHEVGPSVLTEVLRGIEATYPFETKEDNLDGGRFTWTIERPPLYMHYRVRWTWRGTAPQTMAAALGQGKQQ
jgi:hypothetical protein